VPSTGQEFLDLGTDPLDFIHVRTNSLLEGAKAALAAGDRAATLDLLQRAKGMISSCPGLQNETAQTTLL
jgi:hypothetical protein